MRTFLKFAISIPLVALLLVFALANRNSVTVTLDPFGSESDVLSVSAPLFIVLFIVLAIGVVLGGISVWISEGRHRRAARIHLRDLEKQRREMDELRREQNLPPLPPATLIG
jgi:hypothetical protein